MAEFNETGAPFGGGLFSEMAERAMRDRLNSMPENHPDRARLQTAIDKEKARGERLRAREDRDRERDQRDRNHRDPRRTNARQAPGRERGARER